MQTLCDNEIVEIQGIFFRGHLLATSDAGDVYRHSSWITPLQTRAKKEKYSLFSFFEASGNSTGGSFSLPASHRVKALNKVYELNTRVRLAVHNISSLVCNFQFLICIR